MKNELQDFFFDVARASFCKEAWPQRKPNVWDQPPDSRYQKADQQMGAYNQQHPESWYESLFRPETASSPRDAGQQAGTLNKVVEPVARYAPVVAGAGSLGAVGAALAPATGGASLALPALGAGIGGFFGSAAGQKYEGSVKGKPQDVDWGEAGRDGAVSGATALGGSLAGRAMGAASSAIPPGSFGNLGSLATKAGKSLWRGAANAGSTALGTNMGRFGVGLPLLGAGAYGLSQFGEPTAGAIEPTLRTAVGGAGRGLSAGVDDASKAMQQHARSTAANVTDASLEAGAGTGGAVINKLKQFRNWMAGTPEPQGSPAPAHVDPRVAPTVSPQVPTQSPKDPYPDISRMFYTTAP